MTPVCAIDEKKQYDPSGFRDAVVEGLIEAGADDLEAVSKFLDGQSAKLDYRRYGVNLIEILIAGGLLGERKDEVYGCGLLCVVNVTIVIDTVVYTDDEASKNLLSAVKLEYMALISYF